MRPGPRERLAAAVLAAAVAACAPRPGPPEPGPPREPPASPPEAPPPPAAREDDQPPPGVFHRVLRGQTLFTIARTYGASLAAVAAENGIEDPDRIEAGRLLFIPGALATVEVPITVPGALEAFRVPVRGALSSRFGPRRGRMHYGIDIAAPAGTTVRAARDGVVLYAGSRYRGYGKLVILEHGDGFRTLYAHNRKLRTRPGRRVRSGDVIAEVGSTGNATGPHLHFEIRRNNAPLDPLPHLAAGGGRWDRGHP